jgi:superfamily I DNA/RNA helicase
MVARVREAVKAADVSLGDLAVLCFTKRQCEDAARVFADAGIRTLDLIEYDGRPTNALKIGTVKRSKGLEFKQVLVPWVSATLKHQRVRPVDESSASAERESRERRELFVAITRARDNVWVGSVSQYR